MLLFFFKILGNLPSISRLFWVAQFPGKFQAIPSFLVARHLHGTWPIFRAFRKTLKNEENKSKAAPWYDQWSANRPEFEFNVASDFIESVKFGKIFGFNDVTDNF